MGVVRFFLFLQDIFPSSDYFPAASQELSWIGEKGICSRSGGSGSLKIEEKLETRELGKTLG